MRERARRWRVPAIIAGAVTATVAIVACAAIVLVPRDADGPQPDADGVTRACATPQELAAVEATLDAPIELRREPSTADGVDVAFLGDSYTVGVGSSAPDRRWSTTVATRLGWNELNFGASGTGYAATYALPGASLSESYAARIAAIVAAQPDVVVVSGGRNDLRCDIDVIAAGAELVLTRLTTLLPDATIIVVDPWWGSTTPPEKLDEIGAAVDLAAIDAGVQVLDTQQPLADGDLMSSDGIHPDDAGHAAIAEAMLTLLEGVGDGQPGPLA